MVDDRVDVHRVIEDLVPHRYLFGWRTGDVPPGMTHTPTWADLEKAVTADL